MKIAIIGAMDIEIKQVSKLINNPQICEIGKTRFIRGQYKNIELIVAKCDPGKVNAAICTQTLILKFEPNQIINIGVAGGTENMKIGDVAVATGLVQHDVDTSLVGDPVGLISGINIIELPASKIIADDLVKATKQSGICAYRSIFATGDQFVKREKINLIKNQFNADIVDMEGAAIAQACYKADIEFGAIRVVSDNGNAEVEYNKFKYKAADECEKIIEHYLNLIKWL